MSCQFDPLFKHNAEISRVKEGGEILSLQLASFCFTWVCIQYLNFNFIVHSNYFRSSSLILQIIFKMQICQYTLDFIQCISKFKYKLKITPIILWFSFLLLLFCVVSFFVKEQKVLMRNHLKNLILEWFNVFNSICPFSFVVYHITDVNHYNL